MHAPTRFHRQSDRPVRRSVRSALSVAALGLAVTACSVDTAGSSAQPSEAQAETPTEATTSQPAPTLVTPTIVADVAGDVIIEGDLDFATGEVLGTFEVVDGADVLGCDSGSLEDVQGASVERTYVCDSGARRGTFSIEFQPGSRPGPGDDNPDWEVTGGTGDFVDLVGGGVWSVMVDGDGATDSATGRIGPGSDADVIPDPTSADETALSVAPPAALVAMIDRLHDEDDPCNSYEPPSGLPPVQFGLVASDGASEYRTIGETMMQLDLVTGEVIELGETPTPCAISIGDMSSDRRVVTSQDRDRFWLGSIDGSLTEVELDVELPATLISRELTGDRAVFVSGPEDDATVTIVDVTTGETVAAVAGLVLAPASWAVSPDGAHIAIGSVNPSSTSGDGRVIVLDAATGDELRVVDLPKPVVALAFDGSTDELLAASEEARLLTVDLVSGDVLSDVDAGPNDHIQAVGVRPDGMVVVAADDMVGLVDRENGPVGSPVEIRNSVAARIRPDGTAVLLDRHDRAHVVDPDLVAGTADD